MFTVRANTLEEYFHADKNRKADLEAIDVLIRRTTPELGRWFYAGTPAGEPGMRMTMIGYGSFEYSVKSGKSVKWPIIGLALQKNYVSLYLSARKNGAPILDGYKGTLGELRSGKNNFSFTNFSQLKHDSLVALLKDVGHTVKRDPAAALQYSRTTPA
jgi:hypothetical protein